MIEPVAQRAIALCYHDVLYNDAKGESGFTSASAQAYKLAQPVFESHLRMLRATDDDRVALVLNEAAGAPLAEKGGAPVYLTFDDGGSSAVRIADSLERYGFRGHFFVPTHFIGRPAFLTASQVRELSERGHMVGTHSASHPLRMSALPAATILAEWRESKDALEQLIGMEVHIGSVPTGDTSLEVVRASFAAGLSLLFTSTPSVRLRMYEGGMVQGRYKIMASTNAASVESLVRDGLSYDRLAQAMAWASLGAAKKVGGPRWYAFREWWFSRVRRGST